jgi:ankyrin repeat protein
VAEIFEAIRSGDSDRVRALVDEDPGVAHLRDEAGTSALLVARYHGRLDLVETLLERGPELDVFEASALGHADRVRELVDAEPDLARAFALDGFHALGLAAFFRQPDVVRLLLDRGAEVNAVARNAQIRTTALQAAAASGDNESARLLLDAGADMHIAQPGGGTVLHSAAMNGNTELVELLLGRGADAAVRRNDGRTPVDLAREQGHEEIAALLAG